MKHKPHSIAAASAAAVAAATFLALASAPAAAGTVRFVVTDLGTLGGSTSTAYAINSLGEVGGTADIAGNAVSRAFVWSAGSMFHIGSNNGYGAVTALNALGEAAGESGALAVRFARPNLPIGHFGGGQSRAEGINEAGTVVGSALDSAGKSRAFVQARGGSLVDITVVSTSSAAAYAINNNGLIVGQAKNNLGNMNRAALWNNGVMSWIDSPAFPGELYASAALAVNNLGHAVGYSGSPLNGDHAYVWRGGSWTQLSGDETSSNPIFALYKTSTAQGINDSGQIVGWARGERLTGELAFESGFLHAEGTRHDLNAFLSGNPAVDVKDAVAINANGQIAANGVAGGQSRALLLTPAGFLTWRGNGNGNFSDAARWDSGGLGFAPNQFLDVLIDSQSNTTVTLANSAEAKTVLISASNNFAGSATLLLAQSTAERLTANVVISSHGQLTGNGSIDGAVTNLGVVRTVQGQTLNFSDNAFSNQGLLTGGGTLRGKLDNASTGSLVVQGGETFTLRGTAHQNRGLIDVRDGSTLVVTLGSLASSGTVVVAGNLRLSGTPANPGLVNSGVLTLGSSLANSNPRLQGDLLNSAGARLEVERFNTAELNGSLVNHGEVVAGSASTARWLGDVSGTGNFIAGTGARHVFNARYEPGAMAGNTIAAVNLSQAEFAGVLELEIGGLVAGAGHDRINFTSNVWFDAGSLVEVQLVGGFAPLLGQDFALFSFARVPLLSAAALSLPALAPGLAWDSSTLFSDGHLRVAAVPEPAGWALMLAGAAGLRLLGRRRKMSSQTV